MVHPNSTTHLQRTSYVINSKRCSYSLAFSHHPCSRGPFILFSLTVTLPLSLSLSLVQVPNKFEIFDDDIMLRTGAWDQITLWSGGTGFSRQLCDTVLASTCAILAKHEALLHPDGEVKFSHMVGGSTVTPHCGPQDTKIRMHYMVVRWLGLGFYSCVAMLRLRLHGGHVYFPSLSLYTSLSLSLSPSLPPSPTILRAHIPDRDGELVFLATRMGPSSESPFPQPLLSLPDHVPSRPCRLQKRSVEQRSLSAGCRGSGSWGNLSSSTTRSNTAWCSTLLLPHIGPS